ncbi:MAG TPA: DUF4352 domain-containing protein [Blastocatellia bacterium]|nr:DUF4352 domain-containing protein [Blastocatellia bacterium]
MGALLLMATFFGLIGAAGISVYAMLAGNWKLARRILVSSVAGLLVYFGLLFGVSFASFQKTVKLNEEFCIWELCFSAPSMETTKTIGIGANQSIAQGRYYIVNVKIRSDAKRVIQTLQPESVRVVAIDDHGRCYTFSVAGQKSLDAANSNPPLSLPWFHNLNPGESSERQIVFDLPADTKNPSLEITEGQWPTYLVIGDENSFFHKKTRIRLNNNSAD